MLNTTDEKGIFGYENSKHKKMKDALYGFDGFGEKVTKPLSDEVRSAMIEDAKAATAQLEKERAILSTPIDEKAMNEQYRKTARDFLVPSPNDEQRRRRLFATADHVVQDATDSLFKENVKGVFTAERSRAEEDARKEYGKYSTVPGADPMSALGALRRASDPQAVIEKTMQSIDNDRLNEIANKYAAYAGYSPEAYRKQVLEPKLRERLYKEYINEATPDSSAEYIARSSYNNSLTGKMMDLSLNAHSGTNSQSLIDREGLASYDANRLENLAAGIGSLLVDMPMFSGIGSLSSAAARGTANIAKGVTSSLMKKYAAKGLEIPVAERMVEQAFKSKMANMMAGSALTQGLTLGTYDAGHSIADDLLMNDGINIEKAVKEYGHGFATGAAVGIVGTPLRTISRGLTGGKKFLSSAATLGAESAVFTASNQLEKLSAGVDVEPIDLFYDYAESMATLGAMKLAHWRPKGGYAKLNAKGKLREELDFTMAEKEEMTSAGVEPALFVKELESSLNAGSKGAAASAREVMSKYLQMMTSANLSASTRSKLLYLVENKLTSTPPVPVNYSVEKTADSGFRVRLLDEAGRSISVSRTLSGNEVQSELLRNKDVLRRNRISNFENEILKESDSVNFFEKAGEYAREKGISTEQVTDILYKKANNQQLTPGESAMFNDISKRAGDGDARVGYMLQNIRRTLEAKYNLGEGSLLDAIERSGNELTQNENMALDEYLKMMESEVGIIRGGKGKERLLAIDKEMAGSSYGNLSNFQAKLDERRDFMETEFNKGNRNVGAKGDDMEFPIQIPKQWTRPYAWSYYGVRNTPKDFVRLKSRAQELADRVGLNVNFIYDERSIPLDLDNVKGYNNQLKSLGWVDGKRNAVYFNLPNISDIHELEKTFLHEVVAHRGIGKLMGKYLNELYNDIYTRSSPELRSEINRFAKNTGLEGYSAVGEFIAELAEKNELTPKENSLLNRIKGSLKSMLVGKKIVSPDNDLITIDDVKKLLRTHQTAMFEGKHPDEYRASALEKFPSLNNLPDYYDHRAYDKYIIEKYPDKAKALAESPSLLWNDRRRTLYEPEYNPAEEGALSYRLIGKHGAERLAKSKYKDYLVNSTPDEAERLEKEGVPSKVIWERTGWERGADGEWRSEIGEEHMKLRDLTGMVLAQKQPQVFAAYDNIKYLPDSELKDVHKSLIRNLEKAYDRIFADVTIEMHHLLDDPLLYAAYPDIAKVEVQISDKIDKACKYDAEKNIMYVNNKEVIRPESLSRKLISETQRMIQSRENFARSIDLIRADAEGELKERYDEAMQAARLVAEYNNDMTPKLYEELSRKFKRVYGIGPLAFIRYYPSVNDYILKVVNGEYKAQSGDVEAQNAELRWIMPDILRRETPPSKSEATKREDQIPFVDFAEAQKVLSGPLDFIRKSFRLRPIPSREVSPDNSSGNYNANDELMEMLHWDREFTDKILKEKEPSDYVKMQLPELFPDFAKYKNAVERAETRDISGDFYYDEYGNMVPVHKEELLPDVEKESKHNVYAGRVTRENIDKLIRAAFSKKRRIVDTPSDGFEDVLEYDRNGNPRMGVKLKKKDKKAQKSGYEKIIDEIEAEIKDLNGFEDDGADTYLDYNFDEGLPN